MRIRATAPLAAALMVASLLAVPLRASAAPIPCRAADVEQRVLMFKVEAKWQKKSYRIGDIAKLDAVVTQTAEQDPVTYGSWPGGRPMDDPAPNVTVGVGMFLGDVYLGGGAVTNEEGKATVKVKLEKYAKPGTAMNRIYAERVQVKDFPSSACRVTIKEYGYLDPGPSLKVTK